jgi:hypothetical protein
MKFKASLVTDKLNSRFRYSRGGPRGHSRAPDDGPGADATPIAKAFLRQGRDTAEAVTGALDVSVPMNLPDGRSICPSECMAQKDSPSPLPMIGNSRSLRSACSLLCIVSVVSQYVLALLGDGRSICPSECMAQKDSPSPLPVISQYVLAILRFAVATSLADSPLRRT